MYDGTMFSSIRADEVFLSETSDALAPTADASPGRP
jgi:hypothetical protein